MAVLPIAGAGLGLFTSDHIRVPVGASDPDAATAERLQFTLGEGPCLEAHSSAQKIYADESTLAARWPGFHQILNSRTPLRSIIAIPLSPPLDQLGTIDLYLNEPTIGATIIKSDVMAVVAHLSRSLFRSTLLPLHGSAREEAAPWLAHSLNGRRSDVFIAMGMLNAALEVTAADALAVLRAHAFSTETSVDETAHALVTGALSATGLTLSDNR